MNLTSHTGRETCSITKCLPTIIPIRENSYPGLGFEPNWEVVFRDIFHFFFGSQNKSFHELVPGGGIEPPKQAMNPTYNSYVLASDSRNETGILPCIYTNTLLTWNRVARDSTWLHLFLKSLRYRLDYQQDAHYVSSISSEFESRF